MDFPFVKEAMANLFRKPSCDNYPFEPSEAPERYRGRIAFHPERCINCGMCEKVCAGGAITTVVEKLDVGDRISRVFDMGSCTFCSNCADFCSTKAIEMTKDYHMIATKDEDLQIKGTFVKLKPMPKLASACPAPRAAASGVKPRDDGKPVSDPSKCVYCGICAQKCPNGAITIDRANKSWVLDADKCIACGSCASACPKKCIVM